MKHFVQTNHEDDATYRCPCGASERTVDGRKFVEAHRKHTDGKMLVTYDGSWVKFFSSCPKEVVVKV